jgi:hypothetical protein
LKPAICLFCFALTVPFAAGASPAKKATPAASVPASNQCGLFQVTGYLKKAGGTHMILLAPGSRSETQIVLTAEATKDPQHPVILPSRESFITAKIQIQSPITHYRGSAQKISDVHLAVPNELRGDKGTGLKLLEAKPCIFQGM